MDNLIFYKDRDNAETITILEDGVFVDLSAVTKVSIYFKGAYYSSDIYPTAFDLTVGNGKIDLMLGKIPTIPRGTDSTAEIILYDSVNTNGIVWGTLPITVLDFDG